MNLSTNNLIARRRFLRACAAASSAALLVACAGQTAATPTPADGAPNEPPLAVAPTSAPTTLAATAVPAVPLQPTPACDDDDEPTPPAAEGPFYTPNSPQRASLLEPGITGTTMILTGQVVTTACAPIAGALVDLWHCDDAGVYDNAGFRLRGHQFTDGDGRYRFETIMPGLYPGRTRHFHIKVQARGGPVLTTQLYFPDEAGNERDGLYNPALLLDMQQTSGVTTGLFDFVLNTG